LESLQLLRNRLNAHIFELPAEIFSALFQNSQLDLSLVDKDLQAPVEGYRLKADGSL
jgi:hypothetical protein